VACPTPAYSSLVPAALLSFLLCHAPAAYTSNGFTIQDLLSEGLMREAVQDYSQLTNDWAPGLPIRMTEGNSKSKGGLAGISDAFAAALWTADFAFELAAAGACGGRAFLEALSKYCHLLPVAVAAGSHAGSHRRSVSSASCAPLHSWRGPWPRRRPSHTSARPLSRTSPVCAAPPIPTPRRARRQLALAHWG
jgi:hypothetical protein